MRYRPFGSTGVRLSMLGLGTMPFGTDTDAGEAGRIVSACLDVGINHFDCADVYGGGRAEEVLGSLLKPVRDEVFLATKVGFATGPGINERGSSTFHIRRAVDNSLRRLDTDRIDLLYLHSFDWRTGFEHSFRELDRLVQAGKILYIGVSNYAAWQIATALAKSRQAGWSPISAHQPMYNLTKRQAEVELLPMSDAENLAVIPYGPLAGGLLTGKYRGDRTQVEGRLNSNTMYQDRYRDDENFAVADRLVAAAEEAGCHPATLAVAWVASHPTITAPLIGGRTLEQLQPSLAAIDFEMDNELRAEISDLSQTPPPATDRSESQ